VDALALLDVTANIGQTPTTKNRSAVRGCLKYICFYDAPAGKKVTISLCISIYCIYITSAYHLQHTSPSVKMRFTSALITLPLLFFGTGVFALPIQENDAISRSCAEQLYGLAGSQNHHDIYTTSRPRDSSRDQEQAATFSFHGKRLLPLYSVQSCNSEAESKPQTKPADSFVSALQPLAGKIKAFVKQARDRVSPRGEWWSWAQKEEWLSRGDQAGEEAEAAMNQRASPR
jgi:hypothetical protein